MMRPRKAKELIPQIAEQYALPQSTIEDIVNFYWREVWSSLTSGKDIKVHISNLGAFNIKHWLLDKEITKLENYLENFDENSRLKGAQKQAIRFKSEDRLQTLKTLRHMVQDENQRKEFIYEHKKTRNEVEEELIADMEG